MTPHSTAPATEQDTPAAQETLGHYLQHARVHKDITLETVAAHTCIHIATLQALEEDEYDRLPADVFVRGFIKIYANYLGLDPERAIALYQPAPDSARNIYSERQGRAHRILPGEAMAEASPFAIAKPLLVILLLILVAALAYTTYKSSRSPSTPTPPALNPVEELHEQSIPSLAPPQDGAPSTTEPTPLPNATEELAPPNPAGEPTVTLHLHDQPPPAAPAPTTTDVAATMAEPATSAAPAAIMPGATPEARLVIAPHKWKIQLKRPPVSEETAQSAVADKQLPTPDDATAAPPVGEEQPATAAAATVPSPSSPPSPAVSKNSPAAPPAESADQQAASTLSEGEPAAGPHSAAAGATESSDATAPEPAYLLKANFTEFTWLQIQIDDGPLRDYTFRTGEQWEWRASKIIQLHVGNAGGVRLSLNNKQLPALGESGTAVRLTLPAAAPTEEAR